MQKNCRGITVSVLLISAVVVLQKPSFVFGQNAKNQKVVSKVDQFNRQQAIKHLDEGRDVFRYATFGSEAFWGDSLKLHQAIAGANNGGVGPGLSPNAALGAGLKVDMDALPANLASKIKAGQVNLDDPATTMQLIKLNSVIGVTGITDSEGDIQSMGIQCALCHSTVDDAFAPGIGHRLDGWPNRDLNVGAIILMAPGRKVISGRMGITEDQLVKALSAWGPGKYDAGLMEDGKAFQPNGRSAAQLLPAAFGLAGVNLHTYTGRGSVTYWNAYVANTQMHGKGVFYDPRLNDPKQFPIAAKNKDYDIRNTPDLVTDKLAALHVYQLSLNAPIPPGTLYNKPAAQRGEQIFMVKGQCARCHVPPLFTEPGWNMHSPTEIGIDDFQANRSPTKGSYRTTPLKGLWTRIKGGFYHDGRFADLPAVINHYDKGMKLKLTSEEKADLAEYLKSL